MREISERRKKIKKITVVIGALIIPLLYSFFYLGAFWDPYSRLDDVPVAVVNLDQGADINGAHRNLGEEVCDNLEKDGSLAFAFTDQETAKTGTEGNKYYASITIPKDFSQNVASAATTDKQQAKLEYAVNEKRNYLAAQILNSA
ncbi:MAG: YhgE/Pip family protein, partial [Anaerovoracaceae bacterium]